MTAAPSVYLAALNSPELRHALLTPVEVARFLRISRSSVYRLADNGYLEAHDISADTPVVAGSNPKTTWDSKPPRVRRVTRRSLLALLAATANYIPADGDLALVVADLLRLLTLEERESVRRAITPHHSSAPR